MNAVIQPGSQYMSIPQQDFERDISIPHPPVVVSRLHPVKIETGLELRPNADLWFTRHSVSQARGCKNTSAIDRDYALQLFPLYSRLNTSSPIMSQSRQSELCPPILLELIRGAVVRLLAITHS
jgi:hypothetical protein